MASGFPLGRVCGRDERIGQLELVSFGVFRNVMKFKTIAGSIHSMADFSAAVFSSPKTAVEKVGHASLRGAGLSNDVFACLSSIILFSRCQPVLR